MVYTCTDDSRDFEERLELLLFPFLDFSGLSMGLCRRSKGHCTYVACEFNHRVQRVRSRDSIPRDHEKEFPDVVD